MTSYKKELKWMENINNDKVYKTLSSSNITYKIVYERWCQINNTQEGVENHHRQNTNNTNIRGDNDENDDNNSRNVACSFQVTDINEQPEDYLLNGEVFVNSG